MRLFVCAIWWRWSLSKALVVSTFTIYACLVYLIAVLHSGWYFESIAVSVAAIICSTPVFIASRNFRTQGSRFAPMSCQPHAQHM